MRGKWRYFLGVFFLLGVLTTATSVFFEGFARYLVMYLGIAVDIIFTVIFS